MSEAPDILTVEQMKRLYGSFYDRSPMVHLDSKKVPEKVWPLLPYAEFWGMVDDSTRIMLVEEAPGDVKQNLKTVVRVFERDLEDWLLGPEADQKTFSVEYIAFAATIMAADFV